MLSGEKCCDVQHCAPPEPMQQVIEAVQELHEGEYVRLMPRMEPYPLYSMLDDMGFTHCLVLDGEAPYEVMIYKRLDQVAENRVKERYNVMQSG